MWSNISTSSGSASNENCLSIVEPNKKSTNGGGSGSPLMRYKHATCSTSNGYIYIHGGRFGNLPLDDDIWRFDPHRNQWSQMETSGCKPPSLQEHTLVEFQHALYLFGGQVSTSSRDDSFWRLDLESNEWRSLSLQSSKFGAHLGPTNRRGHSAVVYEDSMYIFGGFEDFRGSSAQLWEFKLADERWELRNLSSSSACHPEPRHSHSAIVYGDSMYIYGGLSNLKPLSDLWRWSWRDKRWFRERSRGQSPGQLHGHSAVQAFGSMFVFGGERNGRCTRSLWRLNLANLSWQKIRPKGPRPSPTTWHGAIANPLSILDEANYIIEGDAHLARTSTQPPTSMSDTCFTSSLSPELVQELHLVELPASGRPAEPSANSHQGLMVQSVGGELDSAKKLQHHETQVERKRRSRLSFLRRCRRLPERVKSTYELERASQSATSSTIRHSISSVPNPSNMITKKQLKQEQSCEHLGAQQREESEQMNAKILDNLDTDIKRLFHEALTPSASGARLVKDVEADEMSLDMPADSLTTSRSQYMTARQADETSASALNMRSQRTSYAYTTPPSEMHTPRDQAQQQQQTYPALDRHGISREAWLASSTPVASRYDRRDNRPKSEIVQSLIERADSRIKHLYTPFFNTNERSNESKTTPAATASTTTERQQRRRTRPVSQVVDKSKRHTIHQTMTYYNLYFSEDKTSSSSPPGDSNSNSATTQSADKFEGPLRLRAEPGEERHSFRLIRDDLSSTTIKDMSEEAHGRLNGAVTNGTLVGVRELAEGQVDSRESQLSLDATSSDSRTLCGDIVANGNQTDDRQQSQSSTFATVSSLQNALTARRDTGESGGDNTSMSFSIIAEFEEDDMLQYSSPIHPITPVQGKQLNGRCEQYSPDAGERQSDDRYRRMDDDEQIDSSHDRPDGHTQSQTHVQPQPAEQVAHKSASSGYDSLSGACERPGLACESDRDPIGEHQTLAGQTSSSGRYPPVAQSNSDTQEDYSVRTDSSLGFSTTTETSPEQSAARRQCKRMKNRPSMFRKSARNRVEPKTNTTASSTTADSLALTSDAFGSSLMSACQSGEPADSLPDCRHEQHSGAQVTLRPNYQPVVAAQSREPLVSRKRFFGKNKSKTRYWQLCMFVIGGKQGGSQGTGEPITIWRLYI